MDVQDLDRIEREAKAHLKQHEALRKQASLRIDKHMANKGIAHANERLELVALAREHFAAAAVRFDQDEQHTPGPFHVGAKAMGEYPIFADQKIAHCVGTAEAVSDATLFAASPDLLAALKGVLGWLEWMNDPRTGNAQTPYIKAVRKAIAKATAVKS